MRSFRTSACIDWSGQAIARPKGLAVAYTATDTDAPSLLRPAGGWSREAILDWLLRHAEAKTDIVIGVDLAPALPFVDCGAYFPGWDASPRNGPELWALVEEMAADDPHLSVNSFLANHSIRRHFRQSGTCGDLFPGGAGRMRVCERRQKAMGLSPTSCFNLIGASQVGKSSLTGMRVLDQLLGRVPIWPFDPVPMHGPLIVEIYTTVSAMAAGRSKSRSKIREPEGLDSALARLGSKPHRPLLTYDDHSTDAIVTAAWLRNAVRRPELWAPPGLTPTLAQTEGWTFGVL